MRAVGGVAFGVLLVGACSSTPTSSALDEPAREAGAPTSPVTSSTSAAAVVAPPTASSSTAPPPPPQPGPPDDAGSDADAAPSGGKDAGLVDAGVDAAAQETPPDASPPACVPKTQQVGGLCGVAPDGCGGWYLQNGQGHYVQTPLATDGSLRRCDAPAVPPLPAIQNGYVVFVSDSVCTVQDRECVVIDQSFPPSITWCCPTRPL